MSKYPVRTVRIVHDELRGDEYRLLAGYFRLIGIFVCECTADEVSEADSEYDAVLKISENADQWTSSDKDSNVFDGPWLSLRTSGDEQKKYLSDMLETVFFQSENILEMEKDSLCKIMNIYIDHSLLKYIYSMNYFYKVETVINGSFPELAKSYNDLTIWEQGQGEQSKYSLYARIDMARILNELCSMSDRERPFDTAKLVAGTQKIMEWDSEYYNVYVLNGFLCDIDIRYHADVPFYYQKALDKIAGKPYASYVYYRLGRYYEKSLQDMKKALEQYRMAYEANNRHYRSIYKIALACKEERDYEGACAWYKRIEDILYKKKEKNYLQPIEYEYLFKTFSNMGDIYKMYLSSFYRAAECFEKGIEVVENLDNGKNDFFDSMYGEDCSEYRKNTLKRLNKKKLYRELIDVYTELKDEKNLQRCLEAYKNIR